MKLQLATPRLPPYSILTFIPFLLLDQTCLSISSHSQPSVVLEDFDITVHDVFIHLRSLDPSKATGIDVIPAAFLKYCATTLCEPIHHLLDQCLAQSYLPTEWRTHMVTPL